MTQLKVEENGDKKSPYSPPPPYFISNQTASTNSSHGQRDLHNQTSKWYTKLSYFVFGLSISFLFMSLYPNCDDFILTDSEIIVEVSNRFECAQNSLADQALYSPEQIHLSLGKEDEKQIFISWATIGPVSLAELIYKPINGSEDDEQSVIGHEYSLSMHQTKNNHKKNRILYGYTAILSNLTESSYEYFIRTKPNKHDQLCPYYTSKTYVFKNIWQQDLSNLSVAIYGDLGLINGQSIPRLIKDVDENSYQTIIHNGDFGYDLNDHLGSLGDQFMRTIEPISARVPYQTSVGNHEVYENFRHYSHRFKMVDTTNGSQNSFYYSFNLGPVHFVAYSTEFYYFYVNSGVSFIKNQYDWLTDDLIKANNERKVRPWIIVFGHRPMYCSTKENDDCSKPNNILRKGLPLINLYSLEKLFYEQSVDVILEAHEHAYERFLPMFDGTVYNKTGDPYKNPLAPVHVISGSAGCDENLDPFTADPIPGSVKQLREYGYTRLQATHEQLHFKQISDDQEGKVVDNFTITKTTQNFPPL